MPRTNQAMIGVNLPLHIRDPIKVYECVHKQFASKLFDENPWHQVGGNQNHKCYHKSST